MSLSPGTRLGAYEIVALVGTGGMGEIYRARDTRLDRTVAIKILAAPLAGDLALRDRFEREARAISSLNHPHICTLFDVGHQDDVDFLVLEYLEGETVAERLARSRDTGSPAFTPPEALAIGIDICDALDKAHRSGVVHRDLKPANVFLVRRGSASAPPIAKLLDFGLAKSAAPVVATSGLSMLPTTPPNVTAQGTILGTFQYMSPEQIEGLEADARSDIFAFGALLFEMITGRAAFEGKTRASLLGAILKDEPAPVSRVTPAAPEPLDRIISTCLAKDPDDRYQSARDLLRDLKWVASGASGDVARVPRVTPSSRSNRVAWAVAALATLALIATVITLRRDSEVTAAADPVQFTITPPEKTSFGGPLSGGTGTATQLAVSPDGGHVVFVAGAAGAYQLWLRPLATAAAMPIPGTEGAAFPFWSPDSRFIAFFAAGKLKKVPIAGGPPTVLCDAPRGLGGTWSRDNVIVFTPNSLGVGLSRVSGVGGTPTVVTTLDPATGESNHRWPHFLPDGRHFLYTATAGTCCPPAKPAVIRIGSLDPAGASVTLFQAESSVSYASGHLVFARGETLMAQPFDPDARKPKGDAFPLAEHVSTEGSRYVGASVSENGTLVYAQGGVPSALQLTWVDRSGRALSTLGEPGFYRNLALSPDERRVAVSVVTGSPENVDLWIIDIARNLSSRWTFDPGPDGAPVWSPDGSRIVFEGVRSGKSSLRQTLISGPASDESLLEGSSAVNQVTQNIWPSDWSEDGRFITYTERSTSTTSDVWVLPLFGDRKAFPVVQTGATESSAAFSPDGRWIAYTTTQDGQPNVYVQPFPKATSKHQISRDGGRHPVWRADGKELFYLGLDATMMAVPIETSGAFFAGAAQALFPTSGESSRFNESRMYSVTKDGKRFLVAARTRPSSVAPVTVVVNWTAAIQK